MWCCSHRTLLPLLPLLRCRGLLLPLLLLAAAQQLPQRPSAAAPAAAVTAPAAVTVAGAVAEAGRGLAALLLQHTQQQQQLLQQLQLVSTGWLEAVLSSGRRVPEDNFSLNHLLQLPQQLLDIADGGSGSSSSKGAAGALAAAMAAAAAAGGGGGGGSNASAVMLRQMPALVNLPDAPLGRCRGLVVSLLQSDVCCSVGIWCFLFSHSRSFGKRWAELRSRGRWGVLCQESVVHQAAATTNTTVAM